MNIFERAKQLAEADRSMRDIIRTLKAERYENVDGHLSRSFRLDLRRFRDAAKQTEKGEG